MPRGRTDTTKFSQQSTSSDDAGIMAEVAQQMQSSWEKKRKDRETKYFQDAQVILTKCVSARRVEFIEAVDKLNDSYEKFVLEYAGIEDETRKLWTALLKEQQALLALVDKKYRRIGESEREREKGQVQGMAIAKKALEDYSCLVNALTERV